MKNYNLGEYKPNHFSKPVVYKGVQYLSKAQCCELNKISRAELNEWLRNEGVEIGENKISARRTSALEEIPDMVPSHLEAPSRDIDLDEIPF